MRRRFCETSLFLYCSMAVAFMATACSQVAAAGTLNVPGQLQVEIRTPSEAMLAWDAASDVSTVHVERRDGLEAPFVEVGVVGGDATTHLNTGLTPGATYVWRLRACRNDQCSAYSSPVSVTMTAP